MRLKGRLRREPQQAPEVMKPKELKQPSAVLDDKRKIYMTVNFGHIKEYTNFGLNKTLINMKIQKLADIKSREALMGKKAERDWIKSMVTILIVSIIGVVAYLVISQLLGSQAVSDALLSCKAQLGNCLASGGQAGAAVKNIIPV